MYSLCQGFVSYVPKYRRTHNLSGSVPLDTHGPLHFASSYMVCNPEVFLSPKIDEVSIDAFIFCSSTPQPFLSCFLHFLAIIIMKFAEVLQWIKTDQRPFPVQRCRSIKRCNVSISPGPQLRGLFSHHFGWC